MFLSSSWGFIAVGIYCQAPWLAAGQPALWPREWWAWHGTWQRVKLGIEKQSGAAFVGKPLQILAEEPKLVMEGKIISLQHSIHVAFIGYHMRQTNGCVVPQKFKTTKICSKGNLRVDQRLSAWPASEGKDPGYRNVYYRAETKSAGHFILVERSLLGRLHVLHGPYR